MMRLDRFLASCTELTRSQAVKAVREGRVQVDGRIVKSPDDRLDENTAAVMLDGIPCEYERYQYFMLDKPAGILTARRDSSRETVLDLFPAEIRKRGISPVGRLDKDTSGLLLLTDDGDLAHRVLSPRSGIRKVYEALVEGSPDEEAMRRFEEGIVLADGTVCLPAELKVIPKAIETKAADTMQGARLAEVSESRRDCTAVRVTVCEGKYHQVRRMLAAVGCPVLALRRIRVGGLSLPEDSSPGTWRKLSSVDLCNLFNGQNMGK